MPLQSLFHETGWINMGHFRMTLERLLNNPYASKAK